MVWAVDYAQSGRLTYSYSVCIVTCAFIPFKPEWAYVVKL